MKKASTVSIDKGMVAAHIKPLIGSRTVAGITRRDVEQFMHAVADGKTTSSARPDHAAFRVFKAARRRDKDNGPARRDLPFAVARGLIDVSPVRGVRRFGDGVRERRLSDAEYKALAKGMKAARESGMWSPAIAALQFLALSGWRSSEALTLRWRDVDSARRVATLSDTKSGRSTRPLSRAALDVMRDKTGRMSQANSCSVHRAGTVLWPSKRSPARSSRSRVWRALPTPCGTRSPASPLILGYRN